MNKYSKENAVKNLAFDCKMTSNASRVHKYFCKAGHVWYTAVWYQYAWAGVSLNFSMLYATPVSPQPPQPPPSSPYPYEAPSYWGYDFLPDLGPDCCSLFDLQALVIAHSLDANSPPFTQSRKAASPSNPI